MIHDIILTFFLCLTYISHADPSTLINKPCLKLGRRPDLITSHPNKASALFKLKPCLYCRVSFAEQLASRIPTSDSSDYHNSETSGEPNHSSLQSSLYLFPGVYRYITMPKDFAHVEVDIVCHGAKWQGEVEGGSQHVAVAQIRLDVPLVVAEGADPIGLGAAGGMLPDRV